MNILESINYLINEVSDAFILKRLGPREFKIGDHHVIKMGSKYNMSNEALGKIINANSVLNKSLEVKKKLKSNNPTDVQYAQRVENDDPILHRRFKAGMDSFYRKLQDHLQNKFVKDENPTIQTKRPRIQVDSERSAARQARIDLFKKTGKSRQEENPRISRNRYYDKQSKSWKFRFADETDNSSSQSQPNINPDTLRKVKNLVSLGGALATVPVIGYVTDKAEQFKEKQFEKFNKATNIATGLGLGATGASIYAGRRYRNANN